MIEGCVGESAAESLSLGCIILVSSGWYVIEDDHSLMGGSDDTLSRWFGWTDWRLVSYCRLLLICNVISLVIVPLDVGCCVLHSIYLSFE